MCRNGTYNTRTENTRLVHTIRALRVHAWYIPCIQLMHAVKVDTTCARIHIYHLANIDCSICAHLWKTYTVRTVRSLCMSLWVACPLPWMTEILFSDHFSHLLSPTTRLISVDPFRCSNQLPELYVHSVLLYMGCLSVHSRLMPQILHLLFLSGFLF